MIIPDLLQSTQITTNRQYGTSVSASVGTRNVALRLTTSGAPVYVNSAVKVIKFCAGLLAGVCTLQ